MNIKRWERVSREVAEMNRFVEEVKSLRDKIPTNGADDDTLSRVESVIDEILLAAVKYTAASKELTSRRNSNP